MTTIPLSLYIHLPWCVRKCPYCDFNSHTLRNSLPEEDYIQALIRDLEEELPRIWGRRLISIFMGGGTPSLFSPAGIEKILTAVRTRLNYAPSIEVTMEANPGTVEQQRFAGFRDAGVNRVSLGIQSFADEKLKALGRIHGGDEAKSAVDALINAGFDNFNLDLMHGLPNQSLEQGIADLQTAISFKPNHISWYQLTLEPNTQFHHQPPKLPNTDLIADMQQQGQALLAKHGYQHYEVSAYAKPNQQCQHNLNYWEFGDYLGIGAGAHGKLTCPMSGDVIRTAKVRHPKDYLNPDKAYVASSQLVARKDLAFEFMLNALRLQTSISWLLLQERTGLKKEDIIIILDRLAHDKLIIIDAHGFQLTPLGHQFLNDVTEYFL